MIALLSVRDLAAILFKHKFKIFAAFVATVVTVLIGTLLIAPTYEATSRMLLKFGREYMYRPEVGTATASYRPDLTAIMNAEIQILTSSDLTEKVVTQIGVDLLYPELLQDGRSKAAAMEVARKKFASNLGVKGFEESGVIEVSFQHPSARMAARSVNVLVDLFKEKHLQTFTDPNASSFLSQKADMYEQKLKQSQDQLRKLKIQHTAYSLDEQRTLMLKQRNDLDSAYKSSQDQVAELQQKLNSLEGQRGSVVATARNYTDSDRYRMIDETRGKLLELQLKEQEMHRKYTDSSPFMQEIRKEITTVKDFLEKNEKDIREKATAGNPVYQDLQRELFRTRADLRSMQAKSTVLHQQLSEIDAELKNITAPENDLRDLERQVATNEQNYKTIATKLEEARLSEDMNRLKMTNISIIQAATPPAVPIKPRKKLNLIIGIVLGAFLGIGMALLSEYLNQGLSTPRQAELRLGIPVLATIPYSRKYLTR